MKWVCPQGAGALKSWSEKHYERDHWGGQGMC
jgi:hypothetical protein